MSASLPELLARTRAHTVRFVQQRGGRVLRFESAEDVVQDMHARLLANPPVFEYRGEAELHAWLHRVAERHLANRHAHWLAIRRRPAGLLRLTQGTDTHAALDPEAEAVGPATFAERRDQLQHAYQALTLLLARDADLVRWSMDDMTIAEMAERLGIGSDAAQRARLRALDRFRKAFVLVSQA